MTVIESIHQKQTFIATLSEQSALGETLQKTIRENLKSIGYEF